MIAENNSQLLAQLEHLLAENSSLKDLLNEYQLLFDAKNITTRNLQEEVTESHALKSLFNLQQNELQLLKDYLNRVQETAESALEREAELEKQVTQSVSSSFQLQDIQVQYNYLQVQLESLQQELQQLQQKILLQQQNSSRAAELESLLENAREEIKRMSENL